MDTESEAHQGTSEEEEEGVEVKPAQSFTSRGTGQEAEDSASDTMDTRGR